MREPKPIYAQGFFHLRRNGLVDQTIIFDYYDPDKYYYKILRHRLKLDHEINLLRKNMQYFLDQERVLINGADASPKVMHVEIGIRGRPDLAYVLFLISFKGELVDGLNTYENIYEEETVDYDYIVYWIFPDNARIVEADLGVPYIVYGNRILYFRVPKGTHVGGYERIVFEMRR